MKAARSARSVTLGTCIVAATACSGGAGSVPVAGTLARAPLASAVAKQHYEIEEFALPGNYNYYSPQDVVTGPGESLWVSDFIQPDFGQSAVLLISTSGKVLKTFYWKKYFNLSYANIAVAPSGTLWMTTDITSAEVLTMTPRGRFGSFRIDDTGWVLNVALGSDGAFWLTERVGTGKQRWKEAAIARLSTTGQVSEHRAPRGAWAITSGPDGALWFTVPERSLVCRITTSGALTRFSKGITPGSRPFWITAGPDGALWFTERHGRIGRITTAGVVNEYSKGISHGERPWGIAAGPDGAMWFTESIGRLFYGMPSRAKIGRIAMNGTITEYSSGLDPHSYPANITAGPDGNMWFTEETTNSLGRVDLR